MDRLFRYLILVLVLGFLLRFVWIDKAPASLNWDEVAHGYNAYSLLKTGKDEWRQTLPILLRSFDDYKPAMYAYLTVPFVHFLGLSELSVRMASILSGVGAILFVFLISRELFEDKVVAIIAAALVAVEPWSILFSRAAYEANLALAIFLAGVYITIRSKLKTNMAILGFMLITLSAYAYHSQKILFPMTIALLIFTYHKNLKKYRGITLRAIGASFIVIIPLALIHLINSETLGRLESTSILKVIEGQPLLTSIKQIVIRYLTYFSPANLFVRSTPEPTQRIPGFGMFYNFEFVFWAVGMYLVIKNIKTHKMLLWFLLLSPVPAILTWNWFYPHRVLAYFAFSSMVIALGIRYVFLKLNKLLVSGIILYFCLSVATLLATILFYMSYTQRGAWQYGMKQIIAEVDKHDDGYGRVIFETRTAQPYIFTLFYTQYDPATYHQDNLSKYEFRDVYWPKDKDKTNVLLVGPESSLPTEKIRDSELVVDVTDFEGNLFARLVGLN